MTILITGVGGFIGMHLAKALLANNHTVIGIDNLNSYYSVALKKERLQILEQQPNAANFQFHALDITNKAALNNLFDAFPFDLVIHFAAQAGVRHSKKAPADFIASNTIGFLNILEACRLHGITRLLYASSSSVYGNSATPFSASQPLSTPTSIYAATKQGNEYWATIYQQQFNLKTIGLRFFSVYGEWGRPDMAYFSFTQAILNQQPITVFNHGQLQRDFTYIGDVITHLLVIISQFDTAQFPIYNIGSGRPVALMDFIQQLEGILEQKAMIQFLPKQPEEMLITYADRSRFKAEFGALPITDLKVGLERFVNWYKDLKFEI